MFDRSGERQALDALRAPLRGYFVAGRAPHLLRIALEEGQVKLAPEAVDEEVFEALFGLDLLHAAEAIADADLRHAREAQILNGVAGQSDWVIEKLAEVVDAAAPWPDKHHQIGIGRRIHLY